MPVTRGRFFRKVRWPRLSWPKPSNLTSGLSLAMVLYANLAVVTQAYPSSIVSLPSPQRDDHKPLLARAVPPPGGNSSFHQELQCYLLPFGWIGVISHLLTYYQMICLGLIRSPIPPWPKLSCGVCDLMLNTASLLATVPLAIWTIVRCRQSWELILVSVWMTLLVITQGCMAIHASVSDEDDSGNPYFWLILYAFGIVIGLVGVIAIAVKQLREGGKEAQNVRIVTGSFGGFLGFVLLVGVVILCIHGKFRSEDGIMVALAVLGALGLVAAFYSDLVIAAVADHWSGAPHRYKAVYWVFFGAKRFPLFSL
ncbi:MAG: hypothetical protein M1823_004575 [Watsoniomyces obsoletus]|nr:MAG: hypothetical protein M1823_004575 [Watsoniomyces obsoletus]